MNSYQVSANISNSTNLSQARAPRSVRAARRDAVYRENDEKSIAKMVKVLNQVPSYPWKFNLCDLPHDQDGLAQIPILAGADISKNGVPGYAFDRFDRISGIENVPVGYPKPLPKTRVDSYVIPTLNEANRRFKAADLPFRFKAVTEGPIEPFLNNYHWPSTNHQIRFIAITECTSSPSELKELGKFDFEPSGFMIEDYLAGNYYGRVCIPTTLSDNGDTRLPVVLTHELGHALGLIHVFENPAYLNLVQLSGPFGCALSVMNYDDIYCRDNIDIPKFLNFTVEPDPNYRPDQKLMAWLTVMYRPLGIAIALIAATSSESIEKNITDTSFFYKPLILNDYKNINYYESKSFGPADLYLLNRTYENSCEDFSENLGHLFAWMMLAGSVQKLVDHMTAHLSINQFVSTIISTMAVAGIMNRDIPAVPALVLSTTILGNTLSKRSLLIALSTEVLLQKFLYNINYNSYENFTPLFRFLTAISGLLSGNWVAGNISDSIARLIRSTDDYNRYRDVQIAGLEPLGDLENGTRFSISSIWRTIRNADRNFARDIQASYTDSDRVVSRIAKYLRLSNSARVAAHTTEMTQRAPQNQSPEDDRV